ncbi:Caveolin-1 [Blomia tropicalis]|nr:Caveolin-1 [Blomia tropicalis]
MAAKADSKTNLNESILPLLDDEGNKEKIELAEKAKDDKAEEGAKPEDGVDAAKKKKEEEKERKRQLKLEEEEKKKQEKLEKQKKKEEEKELKKQQKAAAAAEKKAAQEAAKANGTANSSDKNWTSCNFTTGVDLVARDQHSINEHVNVDFEDVIGEPDGNHGIDGAYGVSLQSFELVKFWVYRILMVIISIPMAVVWGVVFAFLSLFSVWLLTPAFRVLDIFLYFVHRLWNALVRTFLDPLFMSISLVRSNSTLPVNRTPAHTFSGKVHTPRNGCQYNQLSTSETVATYTKTDDDNQVTLNLDFGGK